MNVNANKTQKLTPINKVANGFNAVENQFPFQVAILTLVNEHIIHCGGSIVNTSKILTAAHCVTDENGSRIPRRLFRIMAGTSYMTAESETRVISKALQIIVHPKYNPYSMRYDVAVIIVNYEYDFTLEQFAVLSLNKNPIPDSTSCVISGWGLLQPLSDLLPEVLQFAFINILESKECSNVFNLFNICIKEEMICATGAAVSTKGDSGGPLVCDGLLTGIVSFGLRYPNYPTVYTKVSQVYKWIETSKSNCVHNFIIFNLISFIFHKILLWAYYRI